MKRIFTYLSLMAAAFGLASCVDQAFPEDNSGNEPTVAPAIEITVSDVKDSSFTVKIAPQGEVAYYSFLIDADSTDYSAFLDPADVYAVAFEGVAQGTVKYSAHNDTTFTVAADPYTWYTVYAVTASKEGNVGEIVSKTFQTSDTVAPEFVKEDGCIKFDNADSVITLYMTEDVALNVDTTAFTAKIWYGYYHEFDEYYLFDYINGQGGPYAPNRKAKSVEVEDGVITINFGTMPAGAIYQISVPDDAFIDAAGNKSTGFASSFNSNKYYFETGFDITNDVYGVCKGTSAPYTYDKTQKFIFDSTKQIPIYLTYNFGRILNIKGWKTTIVRTDNNGSQSITQTFENEMTAMTHFFHDYWTLIWVKPAGDFLKGDIVTITIPEEAIMDAMGNVNEEEIVLGPYTYGQFETSDVNGKYVVSGSTVFSSTFTHSDTLNFYADESKTDTVIIEGTIASVPVKLYARSTGWDKKVDTLYVEPTSIASWMDYTADSSAVVKNSLILALFNGQNIFPNNIPFIAKYPNQMNYAYVGQAFLGLFRYNEVDGYYDFQDLVWASKANFTYLGEPDIDSSPAPTSLCNKADFKYVPKEPRNFYVDLMK